MCECMLYDVLEEKIQVDSLLKWLTNKGAGNVELEEELGETRCFQGDFVSYFLNYIHAAQTHVEKNGATPQKVSTPKRIERPKNNCSENNVIKRRPALFENAEQVDPETPTNPPYNIVHSTPKTGRNNLNESYASPLSPLYNRQNFTTPKENSRTQPSPRITPTLCLGDFITRKSSSKKKVQRNVFSPEETKTRRINPTNLMQRKFNNSNFRKSENSFTFKNGSDEIIDYSNGQRSFLLEERMRIVSRNDLVPIIPVPKTMIMRRKEIVPVFKSVTYKKQLDVLVLIYTFMLDNNFILNLTSELYFIVSVLLGREYEDVDSSLSPNNSLNLGVTPLLDDSQFSNGILFKTIHNRIYFACKILQAQTNLLKILDKPTLHLLLENKRLQGFTPSNFISNLSLVYQEKSEKGTELAKQTQTDNVCFISDTDNRDNFPNDPSFHAFRKQRDLFYETLRIWENNHLQDEWNFTVALGGKIKSLLNMYADAANLVHFARLFKAQLLRNICGQYGDDVVNENQLSFLASIPNIDAEKLARLKSRIVGKQVGSGINSVPGFTGYQEFYRDFLVVAANHMFNRHLNDALISEIIELNNTKFSCSDFDDADVLVDSAMQNSYTLNVRSLRILAKFLGFLESLPYKSDCPQLPQNVVTCQVRIRNEIQPSLNLKQIVNEALQNSHLILTIPWITKYLAMLDYVTLRLSYFKDLYNKLFEIYYVCATRKYFKHNHNVFLIKLCLGWLFELPNFPEDAYYKWLSENLCARRNSIIKTVGNSKEKKRISLDELDLIDQNMLNVCCPYLQEIKIILSNDLSNANNTNLTIKHITPLTAVQSPTDLSNKRLQFQLEEAFFNGQPMSIRKTVEFISERIASTCVKQICNEIVPVFKKKSLLEFKEKLKTFDDSQISDDEELARVKISAETNKFAASSLKELREQIDFELKSIGNNRVSSAVESLLATDVLKQTKEVCVNIATRICLERVQQWINSHVILGIFTKDFDAEVRHLFTYHGKHLKVTKPLFALPGFGKNMVHNELALSGVETVENIRKHSWDVLEKPEEVSIDVIKELLSSVQQSITERCDLNECVLILINKMLVDFSLLLIANQPELITESVMAQICLIWRKSGCNYNDLFKTVICPRNIMLLSQSVLHEASWKCFYNFLNCLLKEKFLTCDLLESQLDKQASVLTEDVLVSLRRIIVDYKKTDSSPK